MDWHDVLAILSPIITLFILIIGGIVSYFTLIKDITNRLVALETKVSPFWKIVETELPKIIHSPHTPEIDVLLDKMAEGKLDKEEAFDLRCRLKAEMAVPDTGKKIAILLLLARLDQILTVNGKK
jgi:hypothetical protein